MNGFFWNPISFWATKPLLVENHNLSRQDTRERQRAKERERERERERDGGREMDVEVSPRSATSSGRIEARQEAVNGFFWRRALSPLNR